MSRTRVQQISVSLDGFATGEGQSLESPVRPCRRTAARVDVRHPVLEREGRADPAAAAASTTPSCGRSLRGIGAEIMGAGKFGPPGWHEDPEWRGWWGPNPPFHTPTFVLTHHPRPSIEMEGGTTFHFLDAPARRGARDGPRLPAARTCGSAGVPPRSATSLLPGSSTTCTSRWSRSCSAEANASGTGWRDSRGRLRDRGHVLAQRRHPRHLQPRVVKPPRSDTTSPRRGVSVHRLPEPDEVALAVAEPGSTLADAAVRRIRPGDVGDPVDRRQVREVVLLEVHAALAQLGHRRLDVVDLPPPSGCACRTTCRSAKSEKTVDPQR